jgi:cytochrome c oxidase subunit 4
MAGTQLQDRPEVVVHDDEHPNRERQYVVIALVLAAVTAVEVATYLVPDAFGGEGSMPFVIALLAMMSFKFFVVAWYFMHLKFDNRLLTYAFYSGMVLAIGVYLGVLTTFRIWWGG